METPKEMIEQSKRNQESLKQKRYEDDTRAYEESVRNISKTCDNIRLDIKSDVDAGTYHLNQKTYSRTFENVRENKKCESLADLIWNNFPHFGVACYYRDHTMSYANKCEIQLHTQRSTKIEDDLKDKVKRYGWVARSLFLDNKRSKCEEIVKELDNIGSTLFRHVGCKAVMERGM